MTFKRFAMYIAYLSHMGAMRLDRLLWECHLMSSKRICRRLSARTLQMIREAIYCEMSDEAILDLIEIWNNIPAI